MFEALDGARHLTLLLGELPCELAVDLVEDEALPPQVVDTDAQLLVVCEGLVVLLERYVEPRQAGGQAGKQAGGQAGRSVGRS